MNVTGTVFDIKKYAIHDGPGIRTTIFFKGCPLSCWWCHNPEGIGTSRELFFYQNRCLSECDACLTSCPQNAISRKHGLIFIDREKCKLTGKCADACPTRALEIAGMEMSPQRVMEEIEKDRIFYEKSNGGATFSGGEPLLQIDFLDSLLTECRKQNIHTIVDTSGYASWNRMERILDKVDLFFYDLKVMDEKNHLEMTGVSNHIILDNLTRLVKEKCQIRVRIPVISGLNDNQDNISQMSDFLSSLRGIKNISLLPFHKMGCQKYQNLNRPLPRTDAKPPSLKRIEEIKSWLESSGFSVQVGG